MSGNEQEFLYIRFTSIMRRSIQMEHDLPFKTAAEAQEAIINNFNSVVKPNDNLYILGDLTLSASL